ncbi:hypothetical protein E5S67_05289 [Microcoleus sp. IPMA8]|uniref:Uncharacterized protein n=1 Tax=Microcoleus asticus IPMA8 TaxID=2563858 RepID=A0ABX2D4T7_9CYAN|nr:hypothetical protein [Microcoleus asticus IPMA8]
MCHLPRDRRHSTGFVLRFLDHKAFQESGSDRIHPAFPTQNFQCFQFLGAAANTFLSHVSIPRHFDSAFRHSLPSASSPYLKAPAEFLCCLLKEVVWQYGSESTPSGRRIQMAVFLSAVRKRWPPENKSRCGSRCLGSFFRFVREKYRLGFLLKRWDCEFLEFLSAVGRRC